ncbi:hypothetical protein EF847_05125 [Actinobacteria bacterium YIM 96077]|uniref:LapA family protein n=1 Tax=Phytoactinopolyspora halophila TaxID=1981511 RepID=A0A329R6D9_9ACTN|nr:hypothetical protein [Phytoactinopolyspora halophila]AYY12178.1 hypothetical protein EF847_05125 [Actinobacteria bacterium YIM 96077]RAW18588.1 hypothetical protein DPM12_00390 [Phytoactinopolyspora halophila]
MIALSVLLLVLALAVIVVVVIEGGDAVTVEAFGTEVDTTVWAVFVAGVVTGLIMLAGVAVALVGVRRAQARRKEIEYLRQKVAEQEGSGPYAGSEVSGGGPMTSSMLDEKQGKRGRFADLSHGH